MEKLKNLNQGELIEINAGGFAHDVGCAIREGFLFVSALHNPMVRNPFAWADAASGPHC